MTGRAEQNARLSGRAVAVLSIAAGGAIANDYAMQPALSFIAADFGCRSHRLPPSRPAR